MSKRRVPRTLTNRFNPEALQRDLHRRQPGSTPSDIIARYARLQTNGKPVRCEPSRSAVERDDPKDLHSYKKVVFDTTQLALDCARELRTVFGDATARYVYSCRRSRTGHVHLTSKRPADWVEPDETCDPRDAEVAE